MNQPILQIENLNKIFTRSLRSSMINGFTGLYQGLQIASKDNNLTMNSTFLALNNINIIVNRGETIGLIGANGSGKTTLLRLINGIFPPDSGSIRIRGRVGALIAVGAGFHPHMTGRENIYLYGILLGMRKCEINQKFDSIVEFAEIEEALDAPVSTYSSGMYVRLGFSIAIHSKPDIMLVDEILAVGDARFQRKCLDQIYNMQQRGTTFIMVSHNSWNIEALCNRAVLLHQGQQLFTGHAGEAVARYETILQDPIQNPEFLSNEGQTDGSSVSLPLRFCWKDWGSRDKISILGIYAKDAKNRVQSTFFANEPLTLVMEFQCQSGADGFLYLSFRYVHDPNQLEVNLENPNTEVMASRERLKLKKGINRITVCYPEGCRLATGAYLLGVVLYDRSYRLPHYNGYYGFLNVLNPIPNMLRAGKGTPLVWSNPITEIYYA